MDYQSLIEDIINSDMEEEDIFAIVKILLKYKLRRKDEDTYKETYKDFYFDKLNTAADPCQYCSNSPKNGGSGICHCILGTRTFY